MAVPYHKILRGVALRANALTGAQPAALETTYTTSPLTLTQFGSSVFSFTSIKDSVLMAEQKLATVIAEVGNHPWRAFLSGTTADLAHKATLPSLDANSKPILGIYGGVFDSSTGTECTEQPIELIRLRVRNANSFFKIPVYYFKIDGQRILHTTTNVKIHVCSYDRATQATALDGNQNMILPDTLEEALICGGVSYLVRDDEFLQQAQVYRRYFEDTVASIRQGLASVPSKVTPGPTLSPAGT